jgi:hypothetical protein
MDQIEALRPTGVPVKISGEDHTFKCVNLSMAFIAKEYGTPQKAIVKLYDCILFEKDGILIQKPVDEMFTGDIFDVLRCFCRALLLHERNESTHDIFDYADIDELPVIVSGIIKAMGLGNPEPSKKKVKVRK